MFATSRLALPLLLLASPMPAGPADTDTDAAALALFAASADELCSGAFLEDGGLIQAPQIFDVVSPVSWGGAPEPMRIWQFRCSIGAYNESFLFIGWSSFDGLRLMPVAAPDLDVVRADPEDFESAVARIDIVGWSAQPLVMNAVFDPETLELSEYSAWRGIGDAASGAVWRLRDLGFSLVFYEVDASYDEAVNPEVLLDLR